MTVLTCVASCVECEDRVALWQTGARSRGFLTSPVAALGSQYRMCNRRVRMPVLVDGWGFERCIRRSSAQSCVLLTDYTYKRLLSDPVACDRLEFQRSEIDNNKYPAADPEISRCTKCLPLESPGLGESDASRRFGNQTQLLEETNSGNLNKEKRPRACTSFPGSSRRPQPQLFPNLCSGIKLDFRLERYAYSAVPPENFTNRQCFARSSDISGIPMFFLVLSCTSATNLTQSFITPESGDLPAGTYLATGLSRVIQLAQYLDAHASVLVTRLLISDTTVHDADARYGSSQIPWLEDDYLGWSAQTVEEERDQNTKANVKAKGEARDIEAPLDRILDTATPLLEALSYVTYIPSWIDPEYECGELTPSAFHDVPVDVLLRRNYPSLKQLTFRNRYIDGAGPVLNDRSRFPSITHLHLDKGYYRSLTYVLEKFPLLTHSMVTEIGSIDALPSELNPVDSIQGWREKANILGTQPKPHSMSIPGNLTIMVRPAFSLALGGSGVSEGQGVDYEEMIARLADEGQMHLKFPSEEDYQARHDMWNRPLKDPKPDITAIGIFDPRQRIARISIWEVVVSSICGPQQEIRTRKPRPLPKKLDFCEGVV
ncbi:hypothetical protein DFH09DRAFT_1087886 [Mycena vulgaris]|nr:hypothetical protein DFH09DRAFT_1087886 [Mycena vulgaris]